MTITKARLIASMSVWKPSFPEQDWPEIAMAGRSNVGKSSLINTLTHRNQLARTSSAPGKTRLINLFAINECFVLVDLPGYGFARVSATEKAGWGKMIEGYLSQAKALRHVLVLVDIRHEPTADDVAMVSYLRHYEIPFSVVATKADKISRAQRMASIQQIGRVLTVQPWEIFPYSSEKDIGREALMTHLEQCLASE